jgi:hypothetical protein
MNDKSSQQKTRHDYITCLGLPVMYAPESIHYDGVHFLEEITIRGTTYRPAYIRVEQGVLTEVGLQPHLLMKI